MNALTECGGVYCDLAKRFETEVDGQRRLEDHVRHEIDRELVKKLKLKPPKYRRQAADENEEENEDT